MCGTIKAMKRIHTVVFMGIFFALAYVAPVYAITCPDLHEQMLKGVTDSQVHAEVTKLQLFLRQFPSLYPEAIVSGYFGDATERAVQRWQTEHGIASSGTPFTTGYGLVGARTRASIKNACGGANSVLLAPLVVDKDQHNPYQITAHFSVANSQCVSYSVDWGDKSALTTYSQNNPNCKKDKMNINTTHHYTAPGTYTVTVRAGRNALSKIPIVAQKHITITTGGARQGQEKPSHMQVTPTNGRLPLTVSATLSVDSALLCTSYYLDWGDDSPVVQYDPKDYETTCYGNTFERTFTHIYEKEGTYTITAKAGPNAIDKLKEMTINVDVHPKDWTPDKKKKEQKRCFVYPNIGYTPMKTAAYVTLGGPTCDSQYEYYVVWGDGTQTEKRTCTSKDEHYDLFFHEYTQKGDYTAELIQVDGDTPLPKKTCVVEVTDKPEIILKRPRGGDRVVVGKPFGISWDMKNVPGENENGVKPVVRLTFITPDNHAGFIADVPTDKKVYKWIPTDKDCITGVCQTPIVEGKYYIQATMIYDACDGDPFCDTESEVLALSRSKEPVNVFKRGSPSYGKSWMLDISDRLLVYPAVGTAPHITHFTTVLNSNASCAGGIYTLDFGDGTSVAHSYPAGTCKAFAATFSHTYTTPGVHTATLIKNGIKEAQVTVTTKQKIGLQVKNMASAFGAFMTLLASWFNW